MIVEDDEDDRDFIINALTELNIKNEIKFLTNGSEAYNYLNNTNIDLFLIISDVNMPIMNGVQLRDKMQEVGELRLRTVPFLFMTTAAAHDNLITAYAHSVQGFFQKPNDYNELKNMFKTILEYWQYCFEPRFTNSGVE